MKKILIPLIAFVFGGFLSGVTAQTLTLDECIDKALEYNKSLSSAKLKLEQTTFDMKSYKANFYPQFNLMAFDFYSTAKGDFTIDGGHLPIYNYVEAAGKFVPNVTMNADGSYTLNQYADFPSQTMECHGAYLFGWQDFHCLRDVQVGRQYGHREYPSDGVGGHCEDP